MKSTNNSLLDRLADRRAARRWRHLAAIADQLSPDQLQGLRQQARKARQPLQQFITAADRQLGHALAGGDTLPRPLGADWAWRPDLWNTALPERGFAPAAPRQPVGALTTVFHDCPLGEVALRQLRNRPTDALARFGLRIETLGFAGSFLSLVVDLPPEAVTGLRKRHILRMDARIRAERPMQIYARLQLRHGPNTAQILHAVATNGEICMVEFDLAYAELDDRRIEHAWLDLIFESPQMTAITLRDLTLSRRPRAEI